LNTPTDSKGPGKDALYLLPLGGTGEIGMNLNLYGHDGAWMMVDLGITFADHATPGVEVLMPDIGFIEARRDRLVGLVLTHAHEDHIGAVPYLWPYLECPIYATPFTADLVRRKLAEAGLADRASVTEVPLSGAFTVGPFEIELITLTHSIPEPNAMVIHTPVGKVLHTGDWKLDPDPLVGDDYDSVRLQALADEGVLAMVCDSTNALVEGETRSELEVRDSLMDLVGGLKNRVAVACFASNVARLETVMRVAAAHDRRVALMGRSMHRIVDAARASGYLTDLPPLLQDQDVGYLPRDEVMLLCTGSQGEPRSALWRIAHRQHGQIGLDEGDTVIFSSRLIPGNESSIFALQNALVAQGVEVLTSDDHFVHVSGHPGRGDLTQMYQWVRPRIAIPVHGEARHLAAHAKLAAACQVPEQVVAANGDVIRLAPGPAAVVEQVESGRLAFEGRRLLPLDSEVLKTRQRMSFNGAAMVTLVMDEEGALDGDPEVSLQGLIEETESEELDDGIEFVADAVSRLPAKERRDDAAVKEAARTALRRICNKTFGKKPQTSVHLVRFE
jgi:ribonuclease J